MNMAEIWYGQAPSSRFVRTCLVPLSWGYTLGWKVYQSLYNFGFKKSKKPHPKILCIGNLTVGGSGKTPFTVYCVRVLTEMGYEVAVSASGYGSPKSEAAALAPDGELDAAIWGDEPAVLRTQLPHVPLIVGRRRVLAAEIANLNFPSAVLVMDDGFQHLPLEKDVSILLNPPSKNPYCLPAGPYREPIGHLSRADLALPSNLLKIVASQLECVRSDGKSLQHGVEVSVLTAIENPDRLISSLVDSGYHVRSQKLLPDHDPLDQVGLFSFSDLPIVVTLKDWVKLSKRKDLPDNIFIAQHEVRVEPENQFKEWLQKKIS